MAELRPRWFTDRTINYSKEVVSHIPSRWIGERFLIGDNILFAVLEISGEQVRLGNTKAADHV